MKPHNPDPLPQPGRRIMLRRLSPVDLPEFQEYRHDPEVGRYQSWMPRPDDEALTSLAEMSNAVPFQPGEWFQIGIADRETNRLIGDIGVCVDSGGEEAEIGFTLRRSSQGNGLGSEAVREAIRLVFAHTAVSRVIAITDARNLPSIRLLERIGMQKVKTVSSEFSGEPCLEHVYVLFRPGGG